MLSGLISSLGSIKQLNNTISTFVTAAIAMYIVIIASAVIISCLAEQPLPAILSAQVMNSSACSAADANQARIDTQSMILSILRDTIVPELNRRSFQKPQCACDRSGQWTKIAHLNMSDPNENCPINWSLISTPVRGCGRSSAGGVCESAIFPSNGQSYSRVCGRVNAYQFGSPSAFEQGVLGNPGLEGVYLDGVSLTYGDAGSRRHIWSFATALYENNPNYQNELQHVCSCTNTDYNWPYQLPSFIGNNYFCATGNPGPSFTGIIYSDDPLWDGEGCIATDACCEFNDPPWFCTTLPQPTTENMEVRICHDQGKGDEDAIISLIDIYVK